MIRMQLKDLPLLLAGALGAAITGMVAPGLSFLFGEIQKVTSEQCTGKLPLSPKPSTYGPNWMSLIPCYNEQTADTNRRSNESLILY